MADLSQAPPAVTRQVLNRVRRYLFAGVGPIGTAVAHFVLSLVVLKLASPSEFGTFTFLFVVVQLTWGCWSALFCAPLPVVLNEAGERREEAARSFVVANALGAALSLLPFMLLAFHVGLDLAPAICFASFGSLTLMRWFARAFCYVGAQPLRTVLSDVCYGATLLGALGLGIGLGLPPATACYAALLAGAVAGLVPFARMPWPRPAGGRLFAPLRRYPRIWRDHARWSLLGVITTEATANAHVYFITLLKGPAAFAAIAAAALLLRPVNVAQNALSEFERAHMAAQIERGRLDEVRRSVAHLRVALGAIWLGTAACSAALLAFRPDLVFPSTYDLGEVRIACLLWTTIAALRFLQIPESTMLQAAGQFRPLALASVWSSFATTMLVLLLVPTGGTLWSMAGLIVGALVYLWWTLKVAGDWLKWVQAPMPDGRPAAGAEG